ncbi:MAG: LPS export ABC transporter periplasmic protein LptC [Bacteroidota bacterium]
MIFPTSVPNLKSIHFFLASFFLLSLPACKKELAVTTDENYTEEDLNLERMEGVEMLYSDSAKVQVRITAPTMLRYSQRSVKQEFVDGLLVEFFDQNQNVSGYLSAKYGIRYETDYRVVVRDSVVWESYQGEKLDTEELTWDERKAKVYTNKFVTLTRPEEIIFGYGFEADQDFKRSRINAVEGVIKVDDVNLD